MTDWRKIFERPNPKSYGPKRNIAARSPSSRDSDLYLVFDGVSPLDSQAVRLQIIRPETDPQKPDQVVLRPVPANRANRWSNTPFQSILNTLIKISQVDSMNSRYNYYGYASAEGLSLFFTSLLPLLRPLLETSRVFESPRDLANYLLSGSSRPLQSANFSFSGLHVKEHKQGYSLDSVVHIQAGVQAESVVISNQKLESFFIPSLYKFENFLGVLDLSDTEKVWHDHLSNGDILVPLEDEEAFLETVLNQDLPVTLPAPLRWDTKEVSPQARIDVSFNPDMGRGLYSVDLKFQYGSRSVTHKSSLTKLPSSEDRTVYLRSQAHEESVFSKLATHLFVDLPNSDGPYIKPHDLVEFVKSALANNIPVTIEKKKVEISGDFQFSVSSGVDWFDVEGQAQFSGMWIKYPAILESIHRGEKFVPLPNGSVGMVNDDLIRKLEKLATFAEKTKDALRFTSAQGLILNSLLEGETNIDLDEKFMALRKKIHEFSGVKAVDPKPTFQGKLRKYQREGLGWLNFLESFGLGGILADDMGLGKTIQCLAFLQSRLQKTESSDLKFKDVKSKGTRSPSLLIAPKSLLENWASEAKKFTPDLKVHIHVGLDRETNAKNFSNHNLIVTTYQTMLRDIEMFQKIQWDCVVTDEAQAIKNPDALISKATKILPSRFRLAMTGTPIENSIQDLYSISDFVNPGFLNGKRRSINLKLSEESRQALSAAFRVVVLRRTKDQVLKDLPEKTEQVISVDLEPKQLKIYNELKRFYQAQLLKEVKEKGIKKSQIQILAALTRLRQVALHPGLISADYLKAKSSKFEVMLEMLEGVVSKGHRVLVFSQFTRLLALLQKELTSRKIEFSYLDGQTRKGQHVVNEFKNSSCPVFLMSLKAGGVGLNLVEADYVFLMDPWWIPAVEAQAIDRVHRIGQKKAVNAYRFIAKNTVEDKILELQNSKRGLSVEILGERSKTLRDLSVGDIENLFS